MAIQINPRLKIRQAAMLTPTICFFFTRDKKGWCHFGTNQSWVELVTHLNTLEQTND